MLDRRRNVDVYRLIGAGTLEELIYNRQQYSKQDFLLLSELLANMLTCLCSAKREGSGRTRMYLVCFLLCFWATSLTAFAVDDANSERRAYTGVEGEKDGTYLYSFLKLMGGSQCSNGVDRGELFGVKNIFKFQEHSSLTEQSIQACNMAELEYTREYFLIVQFPRTLLTRLDPCSQEHRHRRAQAQAGKEDIEEGHLGYRG